MDFSKQLHKLHFFTSDLSPQIAEISKYTKAALSKLTVYNPDPDSFVLDIDALPKDQIFSDFVIGILLVNYHAKNISREELQAFEIPFTSDLCLRCFAQGFGHPFVDPDGKAMTVQKFTLRGNESGCG